MKEIAVHPVVVLYTKSEFVLMGQLLPRKTASQLGLIAQEGGDPELGPYELYRPAIMIPRQTPQGVSMQAAPYPQLLGILTPSYSDFSVTIDADEVRCQLQPSSGMETLYQQFTASFYSNIELPKSNIIDLSSKR